MKNSIYLWVCSFNKMSLSINGYGGLGEVGWNLASLVGMNQSVDRPFRQYYLNDVGIDIIILTPEDLAPIGEVG